MILNLPLILFQARESEMPSWNILQICANLRPPHAPVVAICPVSFTIICFYASPSHNPHSPKRNDIRIQKNWQTLLHAVYLDRGGCYWLCIIDPHDSWNVNCPLPCTSSPASWTLLSWPLSAQDSSNISSNDRHHHKSSSLDNNKRGILYLFLIVSLMFI